jgi:hypothetical protein
MQWKRDKLTDSFWNIGRNRIRVVRVFARQVVNDWRRKFRTWRKGTRFWLARLPTTRHEYINLVPHSKEDRLGFLFRPEMACFWLIVFCKYRKIHQPFHKNRLNIQTWKKNMLYFTSLKTSFIREYFDTKYRCVVHVSDTSRAGKMRW